MKYLMLYIGFGSLLIMYSACGLVNTPSSKANLPSTHSSSFGGFFHAPIRRGESADGCKECHGSDLKGGVYNDNGILVITQSCYECHSNIWDGGNGGGGGSKH